MSAHCKAIVRFTCYGNDIKIFSNKVSIIGEDSIMSLEKLVMKGVFRRKKDTGKLIIITMFSVFFMAAILLFQKIYFPFRCRIIR